MIKYLSEQMAKFITDDPASEEFAVLAYGYELIFQELLVIVVSLAVAIPLRIAPHVILASVVFNVLRRYAGGTHAKAKVACIFTSILYIFGTGFLFGNNYVIMHAEIVVALYFLDVLVLLRYAPADTAIRPVREPAKRKEMKCKAILVTLAFFAATMLLSAKGLHAYAGILVTVTTIVSWLTHPLAYRLYGCEKSKEEDEK